MPSAERFEAELRRYSKDLFLEWDGRQNCHVLKGRDAHGMEYVIKYIPLGQLAASSPQEYIAMLNRNNPWRSGENMNDFMERIDGLAENQKEEKASKAFNSDLVDDFVEDCKWLGGHRVSMVNSRKDEGGISIIDKRRDFSNV